MKISRFIMIVGCLVAFLTFAVLETAYCNSIGTQSSAVIDHKAKAEKGFFEKIVDGIANIANGIAETISKTVNFLKGERVVKGTVFTEEARVKQPEQQAAEALIQPFAVDKNEVQAVGPQTAEVQPPEIQSGRMVQDKQFAKVESAPVNMIPAVQQPPSLPSVQQPTILQQPVVQQPVVIEQELRIVPEKTEIFARVTGLAEVREQQQVEENENIGVKADVAPPPEEKPAEVFIPKSETAANIPQVKDENTDKTVDNRAAETVPVISGGMIIAGNLQNIPSLQTETRKSTGTTASATTRTTNTQPPIIQSGEVLGTGSTTESPLELMGRQSVAERESAIVQSGEVLGRETVSRSEEEKCGETRVLFSDGIRNAALTADKRYVLADTGEGRKSVVSVCSGVKIDCPATLTVQRSVRTGVTAATEENARAVTDDCESKLTITRGELSEEAQAEMLDVCKQAQELLPSRTETAEVSVVKLVSVIASSSLVYVTNDMVRTVEVDSSDPSKPILDANVLVADNVMQFKPLVFCRSGDAVSDCSGKFDELKATVSNTVSNIADSSSVSCDSKSLENVTLLAISKGVEFSDVLKIEKDASTEPVESASSDGADSELTETGGDSEEAGQDVAGQAAESAAQDIPSPNVYESLPPGGEVQQVPLQMAKSSGPSDVSGGGGCSLIAETDMNIVPIWAWIIFPIGFACVAVRILLKNRAKEVSWHEQKDWNSYRRRRLPRS